MRQSAKSTLSQQKPPKSKGRAPKWMTLLAQNHVGGDHYAPSVEGEIPAALSGALFRNGPGKFERGGKRRNNLLDGDGFIQKLTLRDGRAHYQNEFVRTAKFEAEEKAGRPRYSTWTTRRSKSPLKNLGGGINDGQAGVTVYPVFDRLIARDEVGPHFDIDPDNLSTKEALKIGEDMGPIGLKAHSLMDAERGEWITAGVEYGRFMKLHVVTYGPDFKPKAHHSFVSPRSIYLHDFFATKNHFVFVLHPCMFSPFGLLLGTKAFADCLTWKQEEGNIIAVLPRDGGEPQYFDAPGSFMWHGLNAYEANGEIIADFVGFDAPDHFLGKNALFRQIMRGRLGTAAAAGNIRRYVISSQTGQAREEIIDGGTHEFPMVDDRHRMAPP